MSLTVIGRDAPANVNNALYKVGTIDVRTRSVPAVELFTSEVVA
jgi:hypothetical protein